MEILTALVAINLSLSLTIIFWLAIGFNSPKRTRRMAVSKKMQQDLKTKLKARVPSESDFQMGELP